MVVLGFPCNQFGKQEPGTNEEILDFVHSKFGVEFPMFAKIEVNGDGEAPLYTFLKEAKPPAIKWNFTKFLVDGDGNVVERFEPGTTPEAIGEQLAQALGQGPAGG